jgi:hypothetical protein
MGWQVLLKRLGLIHRCGLLNELVVGKLRSFGNGILEEFDVEGNTCLLSFSSDILGSRQTKFA